MLFAISPSAVTRPTDPDVLILLTKSLYLIGERSPACGVLALDLVFPKSAFREKQQNERQCVVILTSHEERKQRNIEGPRLLGTRLPDWCPEPHPDRLCVSKLCFELLISDQQY